MSRGQYGEAMRVYADLAAKNPKDSRYLYNAGVAAYKALKFDEAQEFFDAASLSTDLGVQQQSFYNRGNSLYKAGENEAQFERKTQLWKEAIDQFENAIKLNESDQLAQENLQYVKMQLENLQQQQQDQENEPDEEENEESEKDNQQQNDQDQSQQNQQDQDQQQKQNPEENQGEQPKDSSNQDQQEPQNGDQNQQDSGDEKNEEQQPEPSEAKEEEDEKEASSSQPQEGEGTEQIPPPTTMTPQQAMQLLESEKDEAKALIFKPRDNNRPKNFKDW